MLLFVEMPFSAFFLIFHVMLLMECVTVLLEDAVSYFSSVW